MSSACRTVLVLAIAGSLGGCGGSDPQSSTHRVPDTTAVSLRSAAEEDSLAETRITPANADIVFESLIAELQAELSAP